MRLVRGSLLALALSLALTAAPATATADTRPLPERMANTGGGTQLITAEAATTAATTGTVRWWEKRAGRWVQIGSSPARFGAKGLVAGESRKQNTSTTPTGLYALPFAFGTKAAPAGARYPYRKVTPRSWWCQDNPSRSYNRWVEGLPKDCRAGESERLAAYPTQYAQALVIGFNYGKPVRGRGAGIFLHVNGSGATAGCVSVPAAAMARILAWVDPAHLAHLAIGTTGGATAITRY
ncbi:L,D-transpeptidase family protein [Streptomyces sp. NPDC001941]|uniref:L,D-transpeptidase family protein n=1 Tax=Streptomyces sp. NPDC001941 TaxID=3154659 RepID=UPI003333E8C8